MTTHTDAYAIVDPDQVENPYDNSDTPGEFRRLTDALGCKQLSVTLIRVPPHSDFEQGTGHYHDHVEELYIVTRGTLTMRFDDDVQQVTAGSAVRVAPSMRRSHRNEGDEPVECRERTSSRKSLVHERPAFAGDSDGGIRGYTDIQIMGPLQVNAPHAQISDRDGYVV